MLKILPWQEANWQFFVQRYRMECFPQAILLQGENGNGKRQFAEQLAAMLLCQNFCDSEPCGHCHACRLFAVGEHPDFYLVQNDAGSQVIKIEQIRELIDFVTPTAHQGGYRVAVINDADAMNSAASNALLKTLEEPASRVIIILTVEHPERLPATIRSRCQETRILAEPQVVFSWIKEQLPQLTEREFKLLSALNIGPLQIVTWYKSDFLAIRQELMTGWLALSMGRQRLAELVALCDKIAPRQVILLWLSLVNDLIKLRESRTVSLVHEDYAEQLVGLAARVALSDLLSYQARLLTMNGYLLRNMNLNLPLLFESLALFWCSLFQVKQ